VLMKTVRSRERRPFAAMVALVGLCATVAASCGTAKTHVSNAATGVSGTPPAQSSTTTTASTMPPPPTAAGVLTSTTNVQTRTTITATSTVRLPATTNAATTNGTVMGGGNPATWPAAKPYPPSLAGAYSSNLRTAFIALVNYSDWVGSHPNPALVKNYATPGSNIYKPQVYLMQQLVKRGWHEEQNPTIVTFLHIVYVTVSSKPSTAGTEDSSRLRVRSGVVGVVIDQMKEPYLDGSGRTVGYSAGGGPTAWRFSLVRIPGNGAFRISAVEEVKPPGGIAKWERTLMHGR